MRLIKIIFVFFALVLPQFAYAHGPSRQKVVESIEVHASPSEVWAVIGNFQDMSWHPVIFSTEGSGENAIDAKRKLHLKDADGKDSGAIIDEVLYKYDAGKMSYSYRIEAVDVKVLPVTNYSAHITVTATPTGSKIEWKGAFYRGFPNNEPPPELNDEAAIAAVTGVYKAGLDALAERFK